MHAPTVYLSSHLARGFGSRARRRAAEEVVDLLNGACKSTVFETVGPWRQTSSEPRGAEGVCQPVLRKDEALDPHDHIISLDQSGRPPGVLRLSSDLRCSFKVLDDGRVKLFNRTGKPNLDYDNVKLTIKFSLKTRKGRDTLTRPLVSPRSHTQQRLRRKSPRTTALAMALRTRFSTDLANLESDQRAPSSSPQQLLR